MQAIAAFGHCKTLLAEACDPCANQDGLRPTRWSVNLYFSWMAGRRWRRAAYSVFALICIGITGLALRPHDDGLEDVRKAGGLEFVSREGALTWHEFQFVEPCSYVEPKLLAWKTRLESSSRDYQMTDIEDRENGPDEWASLAHFNLRAPMDLLPGRNCGFAIGLATSRTWLDTIRGWFRHRP